MINIFWLKPSKMWDCNMLDLALQNKLWQPNNGHEFNHYYDLDLDMRELWRFAVEHRGGVVVIPGRYYVDKYDELNNQLKELNWCVCVILSDEESLFDHTKIKHNNIRFWIQTVRTDREYKDVKFWPLGYPPDTDMLPVEPPTKDLDIFFSGQKTHIRRQQMANALDHTTFDSVVNYSDGFTKGFAHDKYYDYISRAKVVPCPAGAVSPESFRLYEALEGGAVPIADDISPVYFSEGYWLKLFTDPPFPIINDWNNLPGYTGDVLRVWPKSSNKVSAWWKAEKRKLVYEFNQDIADVSRLSPEVTKYATVIVPVSPIPSHPDTAILDECIASIKAHLPKAEIWLTFDGVREEMEHRTQDYEEFKRRVLWKCHRDPQYFNVLPIVFDEHQHQSGMMKKIIDDIETPLILYMEGDCTLTPDREIDWAGMGRVILNGEADLIRLHFEASIPREHKHLMIGEPEIVDGVRLLKTTQWSQRPHLASTAYYRRILDNHFSEKSKSFIEDRMYGITQVAYNTDGMGGWYAHRQWIYCPEGDIKRSGTLNGRQDDEKFDDTQIY